MQILFLMVIFKDECPNKIKIFRKPMGVRDTIVHATNKFLNFLQIKQNTKET
jgi:hypothetical protein